MNVVFTEILNFFYPILNFLTYAIVQNFRQFDEANSKFSHQFDGNFCRNLKTLISISFSGPQSFKKLKKVPTFHITNTM